MRQFTTPIESLFVPGHSLTGSRIFVSFADKCRNGFWVEQPSSAWSTLFSTQTTYRLME